MGTFPTPSADATSSRGITRTIVHAFAMRVTILAEKTLRALCFASYSCFDVKANPSREITLCWLLLRAASLYIFCITIIILKRMLLCERSYVHELHNLFHDRL